MWRRFATFALQKAKYLCPYKSRKVLSQALQFQTLTAQSPVGYVKHRLGPEAASALRRFNRAIERQGQESRLCPGNEGDVIDVGPEGMKR